MESCCVTGCTGETFPGADPVLCELHLAVAGESAAAAFGQTDVLPAPCLACGSRLGVRWPSGWLCAVCEWRHGSVPDVDVPPPRLDVVYYLRYRDRVKIGTTASPRQRLAAILHDEVLAFERGDRTRERRRHEQFAADRFARTEWFRFSPALRSHVEVVSAGVDDPWRLVDRWRSEAWAALG